MGPKVIGYINRNMNYDFNYQGYDFFADEITLKAPTSLWPISLWPV